LRSLPLFLLLFPLAGLFFAPQTFAQNAPPKLLLSATRARRLSRDHTRMTERWANLDQRVASEQASPERGFELALFYSVTGDAGAADEAIRWAAAHPDEFRQVALVADWCRDRMSSEQQAALLSAATERLSQQGHEFPSPSRYRDALFLTLARTGSPPADLDNWWARTMSLVKKHGWPWLAQPAELYALAEIITVVRDFTHTDLRSGYGTEFELLPTEYLLSLRPAQVETPDWETRIAALALVDVDPNMTPSQFLQGWAMEDPRVIRSGPGIAYEFLWANPYLPGLSYYNLDPWSYDPDAGVLYLRSSWDANSCWIRIDDAGVAEQDCPAGWRDHPFEAGHLTLAPLPESGCVDVPHQGAVINPSLVRSLILWGVPPGAQFLYKSDNKLVSHYADRSGMLRVPSSGEDRICLAGAHDAHRGKH